MHISCLKKKNVKLSFCFIIDYSQAFHPMVLEFFCLCFLRVAVDSFSGGVTTYLCEFASDARTIQCKPTLLSTFEHRLA